MMWIGWTIAQKEEIRCSAMNLMRNFRGIVHTRDRGRNQGRGNPGFLLPVMDFVVVPAGPSSRIARRCCRGVLLRFERRVGEDARLGEERGRLHDRAVPVLVQLADAEAEVVDDALVFLAPGLEFFGGCLDGLEAHVLAELRFDDPLLHYGFHLLEALVQRFVGLEKTTFEERALFVELLLGGSLRRGEFLELREKELCVGIHGVGGFGTAGIVYVNRGLGRQRRRRRWWRR
jgi:hypothetical protein